MLKIIKMQIIVEYSDSLALKLLQDLEQLKIVRLLPIKQENKPESKKRRWAGTISATTAEALHTHIENTRKIINPYSI